MNGLATTMALMRGLHLAAMISLLGTVGFLAWILPASAMVPPVLRQRLSRLWWVSGVVAVVAGGAWFTLQAAAIADAGNIPDALTALPMVAWHTRYGNTMMIRLGLLLVATGLALVRGHGQRRATLYLTVVFVSVALGLQGRIGHAGATEGAIGSGLILAGSLHLLAAGLWLGALIPLWLSVRAMTSSDATAVCERFSPIGLACVLVLAGTGFAQGLEFISSVPGLFGTPYGHIALLKIALFLLALMLATFNRFWLTGRLAVPRAHRHLLVSVAIEAVVGLGIVTAGAFMASSIPAAHTTPVWPFSWQFSLIAVNEDPGIRDEVLVSVSVIGAATALMVAALLRKRFRLIVLAILSVTVVVRGPSLALLTVGAYPTSFQTSPTGFTAASIARGQIIFSENCTACHGPNADGKGPAAAALRIKPADLTMPHIWEHRDGEMFWWLTHGVDDPEGGLAMPGFGTILSVDDRWALVDFIRAHNAGVGMQQEKSFDVPLRAPAFAVTCAGIGASNMADLQGSPVHVVTSNAEKHSLSRRYAITLDLNDRDTPASGSCVAADPAAWSAYAVLADLPAGGLAGSEFLIDPNGWLRAAHRADAPGGWQTGNQLLTAIYNIRTHPLEKPTGGHNEHHH
jgi:putative copper export protein/mono/diheme cytochrome c family protein